MSRTPTPFSFSTGPDGARRQARRARQRHPDCLAFPRAGAQPGRERPAVCVPELALKHRVRKRRRDHRRRCGPRCLVKNGGGIDTARRHISVRREVPSSPISSRRTRICPCWRRAFGGICLTARVRQMASTCRACRRDYKATRRAHAVIVARPAGPEIRFGAALPTRIFV